MSPQDLNPTHRSAPSASAQAAALQALVGVSESINGLRRQLPRLAASDCSVLVTGETGTGKECVAQALHALSAAAQRAVRVDQLRGAARTLLESELFGYERGAFTGAQPAPTRASSRWPTAAPCSSTRSATCRWPLQAKLLRVLRSARGVSARRAAQPARGRPDRGGDAPRPAAAGARRAFPRRPVLPAERRARRLPPLRERREDVAVLFDHFAAQLAPRSRSRRLQLQPRRWTGCAATTGRATRASCATWSNRPASCTTARRWPRRNCRCRRRPAMAANRRASSTRSNAANGTAARPRLRCTGRA